MKGERAEQAPAAGVELPGRVGQRNRRTTEWFMSSAVIHRTKGLKRRAGFTLAVAAALVGGGSASAGVGTRHPDPSQVVPLDQIAPEQREVVAEVIRDHTIHRLGETESFACASNLYLTLVNEPLLPLALWRDLADSPVRLQKVAPNRYEGNDGAGSTAVWEFALRSPRLHVLVAYFNYVSPRGTARVDARIVLLVRTNYIVVGKKNEPWIQHEVEAFVKVDSKGWKTLARTVRPLIERILEDQVREAGYFISLMTRLVLTYPNWACQVVASQSAIETEARQRFLAIVSQSRHPGARSGRPVIAQNGNPPNQDLRQR
jgi:hypothetical protein